MTAATLPRPTRTELALAPPALAGPKLRIAYLTAEYPKVSHTFIRREISELTRRGHEIFRVSIRPPGPLVDPADHSGQPPLEIDFRVRSDTGKPELVDFGVAGVWIGLSQRDQFVAFLGQNGGDVETLTSHLRNVTAHYH